MNTTLNKTGASWFRVSISNHGIQSVERVEAAGKNGSRVYYVAANSKEEAAIAGRAAFNSYCAAKKRERMARLAKEGRCRCGRERDSHKKQCMVCLERQKLHHRTIAENKRNGVTGKKPRNEAARVASNQARQRDRRKEIRLETLLEVRKMRAKPNFGDWLEREISKALAPTIS